MLPLANLKWSVGGHNTAALRAAVENHAWYMFSSHASSRNRPFGQAPHMASRRLEKAAGQPKDSVEASGRFELRAQHT